MLVANTYKGYSESKDTKSRHFKVLGGGGFICSTFTTHFYLFFNIVTMDRNALSEPGNESFYSTIAEISHLLS
jgi:hypothetical protein